MNKTVIIMAAGMGSRYGGLKQLDTIGPSGEAIIDYSVFDAIRAGFNKIVFVIRKDIEEPFKAQIGAKFAQKVQVEYVFQDLEALPEGFSLPEGRTKPWGTGQAMLAAADVVSEPFIIINADDFYGADAFQKASDYLETLTDGSLKASLVGFMLGNTLSSNGTVSRGVCSSSDGILTGVDEIHEIRKENSGEISAANRKGLKEEDLVSMNYWCFSPAIFEKTEAYFKDFLKEKGNELKSEFYIPLVVNQLIEEEKLQVEILKTTAEWFGVTYKEDKPEVVSTISSYVEKNIYPNNLWK